MNLLKQLKSNFPHFGQQILLSIVEEIVISFRDSIKAPEIG
jgi:hypothetical protein